MTEEQSKLIAQLLTDLILAIVTVGLPLLGTLVWKWLQRHLTQQQLATVLDVSRMAVKAAESYLGSADGAGKLQYAMMICRTFAAQHDIRFSDDQWRALIEQSHHELEVLQVQLEKADAHVVVSPNTPATPTMADPAPAGAASRSVLFPYGPQV